jgi:transposase
MDRNPIMSRNHIGVDLSKHAIDICDPRRGEARIANEPGAIAAWLAGLGPEDVIVYEATSRCDRPLRRALAAAAPAGVRLNPLHAWHFARSLNRPKTDRVDAAMLARLGAERQPRPDPAQDPAREALRALVGRRDQLKRMEVQEKNRLADCAHSAVARDIEASLAALAERRAAMEKAIAEHIASHPALAAAERLLRGIPCLGTVTAMTLLAHLRELGCLDRRAIASIAGLAPRANESGTRHGRRRLGEGRRHLRRVLYMAAMSAMRRPGFLAGFVARQKAAGKPGKVVLMAVARRLLVIANAVLRTGTPYRERCCAPT